MTPVRCLPKVLAAGLGCLTLVACGEEDVDRQPNTGGTGGATSTAGSGGSGAAGGTTPTGGTGGSGTAGSGGAPVVCGDLLLEEDFADADLASRGWTGGLSGAGYSVVADADLGHNAFEFGFQPGAQSPGGSVNHEFSASEEITIHYRLRVGPTWQWTVPHHMIMMHSNRDVTEGNGSPANAYGSTYFEWEWNDAGIFIGKFQDNRAINCAYGCQDLRGVTEDRSVGGFQTWWAPTGQDASYWGDPCQGGLDSYTGQSVLTLHTNGATHPMTQDEWWSLIIHLRMNSIQAGEGQWDGGFHVEWQGPSDTAPVVVMDHQNVLWRAGGWSADLRWAKFMMAPYLHDGATQAMWVRIADIRIYDGWCPS